MAGRRVRCVTALVALVAWLAAPPALAATHSRSASSSTTTSAPTATAATTPGVTTPGATTPGVATNAFGGANPISPVPTTTTSATSAVVATSSTATSGGSSLSTGSALAIAVGAFAVLGGISFFIWRDARRRAPVRSRSAEPGAAGNGRRAGSKPPPKPRKLSPAERRRRKRGRARR
jgi:hypothetical protein